MTAERRVRTPPWSSGRHARPGQVGRAISVLRSCTYGKRSIRLRVPRDTARWLWRQLGAALNEPKSKPRRLGQAAPREVEDAMLPTRLDVLVALLRQLDANGPRSSTWPACPTGAGWRTTRDGRATARAPGRAGGRAVVI